MLSDVDVRLLTESAERFLADRQERILKGQYSDAQGLASLWQECMQLGWQLTCVPQEADGAGLGTVAAAALLETAGNHLLPLPLAHGVALAALLADIGTEQEAVAQLASWLEGVGQAGVADEEWVSHAAGNRAWRLAWNGGRLSVEWVPVAAHGYGVDPLVPVACVADGPVQVVQLSCDPAVWQGYCARVRALTLAEMLGAGSAALALSVAYACERQQFGKPIGANQAVKHRLADNRMALDDARLVLQDACAAIDAGHSHMQERLAMAELLVMEVANAAVGQAIQTHGAMGITWECPVHFYFKRVKFLGARLRREQDSAVLLDRIWELASAA